MDPFNHATKVLETVKPRPMPLVSSFLVYNEKRFFLLICVIPYPLSITNILIKSGKDYILTYTIPFLANLSPLRTKFIKICYILSLFEYT
jgi:hypothetical protein